MHKTIGLSIKRNLVLGSRWDGYLIRSFNFLDKTCLISKNTQVGDLLAR